MNRLRVLHDKVKYHKFRENIVTNAGAYRRYISAFEALLNEFAKEIENAKKTDPAARDKGQQMLFELDRHGFLSDTKDKLLYLSHIGGLYYASGRYDTESQMRVIMAQLESALSSIHEYIVSGMVSFFLYYPDKNDMRVMRFKWQKTGYIKQS
ncbi:MAG: hypothetical protein NC314_10410 [Roseburia sp.]|nr:hypothetical protein [Roseburia sp.]MCM1243243.1 hypothetical protein [Roseburia sp.]